jgi:tetratricopeptide (TPR) repeat protein
MNGQDISAHLAMGRIKAKKKGESAAALKAWDRSIQAWPDCFRCHKAKAQYIESKFGLADALPIWERVLQIAPEDTSSLTRYAKAQVGRNDDKALFAYETALKGGKKDFETYMAAAKICIRLSKVQKAIGFLEAAVELDKTNRDTRWSLALMYEKGGLEDKYIESLNKMLEFEPNNDEVHLRLARLLHKKEEMVGALRHYDWVAKMYRAGGDAFLVSKASQKTAITEQEELLNQLKIGRGFTGGPGEVVGTVQYRSNKMFQQRVRTQTELGGAVSFLIVTNERSRVLEVTVKEDELKDDWVIANIIGNFKRAIIWGGAKRYNIKLEFAK